MVGKNKNVSQTAGNIGTVIGSGSVFDGNLTASESTRIDGTLNGNCTCEGNLVLGKEGKIEGNISAQNVTLSGKVNGDIIVKGKLELFSTAKVSGNITAKSLIIDENASFDGRCTMTTSAGIPNVKEKEPQKTEKADADSKTPGNNANTR